MASKSKKSSAVDYASHPPGTSRIPTATFALGIISLLVAVVASGVLSLNHLGGLSLPGCGEGSPCAEAAASVWGSVPGIKWPVSFLGFAYFAGAMVAWLLSRGGVSPFFGYIARLGAVLSVGFLVILFVEGHICYYCIAAHIGNLGFWFAMERTRKVQLPSTRPIVALWLVFAIASGGLGIAKQRESKRVLAELNKDADEAIQDIIESADPVRIFAGRYRMGPEKAPIRLVILTDYQCPDCRAVEHVARQIMQQRQDVSLSIKHAPMNTECNPTVSRTMHANACWAARAAEAAGMLQGDEGFFKMHHWLFDRKGEFQEPALRTALDEFGFDADEFIRVMMTPDTMDLVLADAKEAGDLGLFFTPMIFINGVQLRSVFAQNANKLRQAVEALAATNPPAQTAAADRPIGKIEKSVGDWSAGYSRGLPPDSRPWAYGPETAPIQIVMWSDYQEPWTPKADVAIRAWMQGRDDVRYSFRHFPFDQTCNQVVSRSAHPKACLASRAAEAAGIVGGVDAYWKMHVWLMENQTGVNEASARSAAVDMGLDAAAFAQAMAGTEASAAIDEDCRAAKRTPETPVQRTLLYRGGIPTIYINGMAVPRWRLGDEVIIKQILDEAARLASGRPSGA